MNIMQLLNLKKAIQSISVPKNLRKRIEEATPKLNSVGLDSWGFDPESYGQAVNFLKWFYTDYFRVEATGMENLPEGRLMLIANHGCQIPLDAVLIAGSMILDAPSPRVIRAMVDRWVPTLPFISSFFTRMGQVVGAPENCAGLLNNDNCVLIFPEGTRGSGKDIFHKYQLQKFGSGFVHIAAETKTPIIPVSIIGTEEIYPSLYNLKSLAKLLGIPYFPITPLFPFFGPAGAFPFPTKVSVIFGNPYFIEESAPLTEVRAQEISTSIKNEVQKNIDSGIKIRGNQIFTKRAF